MERFDVREFQDGRLLREGTWVVAFLAEWCPFCRAVRPILEAMEQQGLAPMACGDVTDDQSPLWAEFRLEVIPTVIVFRNGAPVFRADGGLGSGLSARQLAEVRDAALVKPG